MQVVCLYYRWYVVITEAKIDCSGQESVLYLHPWVAFGHHWYCGIAQQLAQNTSSLEELK